MRVFRTLLLCTAAMAFAGCDEDGGLVGTAPNVPLAYTRFVNAVPDTGGQDWRFVDQLEYSPPAYGLAFRGFTPYQGTGVGSRNLRVFPTSSDINVTSTRLIDTTLTFQAGTYYTIVHVGMADPGAAVENRIIVIQDDIPATIDAGDFAIRAMHLGTGWGNVDVYGAPSTSAALPTETLFPNVAYLSTTAYTTLDVGAVALRALPAGQVTPAMANALAPAGDAGNAANNLSPIGGTSIGGSAILAIFTPGSVVGTSAPQGTAFIRSTSDTTLFATPTGYARVNGSFITDGFFVGQEITVDGFDAGGLNNGTSIVTDVTATTLTVTKTGGTEAELATTDASIRGPRPNWVYIIDRHPR